MSTSVAGKKFTLTWGNGAQAELSFDATGNKGTYKDAAPEATARNFIWCESLDPPVGDHGVWFALSDTKLTSLNLYGFRQENGQWFGANSMSGPNATFDRFNLSEPS